VPNYHAWPDEVRSSPYADQLSLGFRRLRFSRALEREYRAHMLEDGFGLKRIALCVATVIWLALTALDMLVVPASHLGWVIAVRLVVLVILLVCATLILRRRHSHLLLPLSMTCILVLGVGAAMIVGIAHRADPGYPYEGLLLVSMAAYFLVGLRLNEALACDSGIGRGAACSEADQQPVVSGLRQSYRRCRLLPPGIQITRAFSDQPPDAAACLPRQPDRAAQPS
jgi:hypothetical protein